MAQQEFERLVNILVDLREKCPWDRKQTIQSLRQMTIEETYELADAIIDEDWKNIKEELGDLMLHLVFYAKIASEQNRFTIEDVVTGICEKLILRHPHVYPPQVAHADLAQVRDEEDVKKNWEKIKLQEGKESVLSGVPVSLPSIVKAMRLQEKAKQVGFEWETKEDVWLKIEEELGELREVVDTASKERQEEELGDLLFSIVNYSRFLKIDADAALEHTNKKFKRRFMGMEKMAHANGSTLNDMTLSEMDAIWNNIKQAEK
ncbi:MAG TPA: nucleoside triphosphate pyrophosphohydrolase [Niabella sp.]|nr:nucleoside triphosphate pyrophosphohydrolase [Niabella sp.]HQW14583.1 nucleoside triphosphate pyrophosphohydrolase [Niabella sp.]HQX19724.1 nucleoside triphosphate pyrophosphohydrolase [Niabella sp.]HQX41701.1 nucleoside triphosphate pyrophosphohydrolase [Niabella sp.]HRB07539.1 nucleoside triphosphate pyrophosphohydrolase [Niabella sp.]